MLTWEWQAHIVNIDLISLKKKYFVFLSENFANKLEIFYIKMTPLTNWLNGFIFVFLFCFLVNEIQFAEKSFVNLVFANKTLSVTSIHRVLKLGKANSKNI